VLQLMSEKEVFLNSVQNTHTALKNIAGKDAKDETFPKLPHLLRANLEKLRTTLAEHNITFHFTGRTASGIKILFSKTASPATLTDSESGTEKLETTSISVPDEADAALSELIEVEFDEMPEVINV